MRRMVREAKKPKHELLLMSYRRKQHLEVGKYSKLLSDATSITTDYLDRIKNLSCHATTNVSAWSLVKATGTLTGTVLVR